MEKFLQKFLDRDWSKNTDVLTGVLMITVIFMMVIPIPTFLLDVFIAVNLALAVVVVLSVMYVKKAIDFSVFPSLLLVTTLFRLALNVSSTRLILLQGENFNGQIIRAFGNFVVGGSYIVGIVIFLILVMIQFMVIVKGATRVSEVAARFTLDAMPGKQMSIDADLNAGIITEREAINRREELRKEADFYGAMDGASKFVQGDVLAGLIITGINIAGGLLIGIIMRGEDIKTALSIYTILTIGDGLVSQIPSLLLSTSTGLIVSRAASDDNLGTEFTTQLTSQPRALLMTGTTLLILGVMPGFRSAWYAFLSIAGVLIFLGWNTMSQMKESVVKEEADRKKKEDEDLKKPENVVSLLTVDPMELEIGYSLIPLVDPKQGGDLLERITLIRRQSALDIGLIVPPIRIRDNMQLKPEEYSIKIKGVEIAKGQVYADHFLAMNPGNVKEKLKGKETIEPAFGVPAIWITDKEREKAEIAGYTVVDPPSIIATHLTEIIRVHAFEILGRQEAQTIIDNVKKNYPAVVDDLVPGKLGMTEIHRVLQNLLIEGISIRDTVTILETLSAKASITKDIDTLTEYVRQSLARQITKSSQSPDGKIYTLTVDPHVEEKIISSLQQGEEGKVVSLDQPTVQKILANLAKEIEKMTRKSLPAIVLTSPRLRLYFKRLIQRYAPGINVLSYNEITPDVDIRAEGMVTL